MFEDRPAATSSGHHIFVGMDGGRPTWRSKLLDWFRFGKKKMVLLVGGSVLLVIIAALLLFLFWPSANPTPESTDKLSNGGQTAAENQAEAEAQNKDEASKPGDAQAQANGGGSSSGSGGSSGGGGSGSSGGSSGGGGSAAVSCPNATHTPGGPDGFGGCWPYAGNTGIPAGTVLSAYTGSCTVTTNNLSINAKTVNCNPLEIRASNVQITNSKINGTVYIDQPNIGYSFTITDSEVDAGGPTNSGIGKSNFTATRVHVYGGYRSIWCEYSCTVQDSWLHGQAPDPSGVAHESAVRMGDGSNIRHNSILCDAPDYPPDAGCSANLTGTWAAS